MEAERAAQQGAGAAGRIDFVNTIIPAAVTLILFGIIIYIIRAFMIKSLRRKDNLDEKKKVRLVRTVTTVLAIVAILIVVSGYGLQTSTLIALMGVTGLSLSLSVQGLLSNFFSGCLLPLTRPFREGDAIDIGGTTGIIDRIGHFNATLVTLENVNIVVPNSVLTSGCITNFTARETLLVEQTFSVSPDMADEDVRAVVRAAIAEEADIRPPARVKATWHNDRRSFWGS